MIQSPAMKRIVKAAAIAAGAAALGATAERLLIAAPHYHGPVTDHFDGERFHNQDAAVHDEEGSFLQWQLTRQPGFWPDWVDDPPGPPPPAVVDGGRVRVTFINHATLLVQMDGLNILTDPIWSDRTSPVSFAGPKRHRAPGIRFEDLPRIDAILVSHNHYDHLDVPTLLRLRAKTNAPIVTPLGNARLMHRFGIGNVVELDWWRETALPHGVRVTVVPSQHFCARGISDRDRNLWGGFVVSGPSGNAYFAGDTGFGRHFEQIAQRFPSIRVALLPIGAYLPRWFMRPVHVDPVEAVEAHRILGAKTSIAMHFGTFHLGDDGMLQPVYDLQQAIRAAGNPNFRVLAEGEGLEVE